MEGSATQLPNTDQSMLQVGYHGTASERLQDILDNGFKAGTNVKCQKFGIYVEPENTRQLITMYVSYCSSLPSKPGYLIGSALVCNFNPRYTERPCPGSHQRVVKTGAIMPVALVTHFLDGRQLCEESRKACYKIHRGEFDAAGISLEKGIKWKAEVKAKHRKKIESDNENKRRKVSSSSSSNPDGVGLESVTRQTISVQVQDADQEETETLPPVHIVSRDSEIGCIQIDTEGERPQVMTE